ncbi:ABC transporter ATP-binding protein [Aeromicrobium sp. CTD01-1L150]|uniref:ABC transporter ATP-binding protein n=1 Tax=Aeromicrobium sp. CTD01-1L150 TaxID=3341830 RepID=UPI0035C0AF72
MNIDVQDLTLKYGDNTAIDDLSLVVEDGEALVLLGQSGCGKTSTMRCIAGLETPSRGVISIGGDVVFDGSRGISRPPNKRNIGMVFQSYAIWPHLTVFENVAFPLTMAKVAKAEIRERVVATLELVGLGAMADRGASLLSGGQMQRVALARSLVMEPSVLLLDEPLSNLDARLRDRLRLELRELQQRLGLTSIYVTHDQEEALALADRIALMQFGRIVQVGPPHEIYENPASASIADFLGVNNILPAKRLGASSVTVEGFDRALRTHDVPTHSGELRACFRAEDIQVSAAATPYDDGFDGTVVSAGFQGATIRYLIRTTQGAELNAVTSKRDGALLRPDDAVSLRVEPDAIQVLPVEVEAR